MTKKVLEGKLYHVFKPDTFFLEEDSGAVWELPQLMENMITDVTSRRVKITITIEDV